MRDETITWNSVSPPDSEGRVHNYPDAELTVQLFMPTAEEYPVWPGYWDGLDWMLADGTPAPPVEAWADMPEGPCDEQT